MRRRQKIIAVLSGPTQGLGRELLLQMLKRGISVVVIGRRLQRIEKDVCSYGAQCTLSEIDLNEIVDPGVAELFDTRLSEQLLKNNAGTIVFISNAGIVEPIGMIGSISSRDLVSSTAVNFLAPAIIANTCVRVAKRTSAKLVVVNISSGAATHAISGWSAYCATKSAARMYVEVLKNELNGIAEVHQIDPGVMNTNMQGKVRDSTVEQFPFVANFIDYAVDGVLRAPEVVAYEILEDVFMRAVR
jgi:NAD(P)-dependent dehydrogenase (short-subunit alcohol dehydrogenase family)